MPETAPAPITYGDEITVDSISNFAALGSLNAMTQRWMTLSVLVVSRDGSRRIVRVGLATLINTVLFPAFATAALHSHPGGDGQRWEGVRKVALDMPKIDGQKVLLWNRGDHRRAAPKSRYMVGLYVPYGGSKTAELSVVPVNHVPVVRSVRADLADIASGWDTFWHGRYVFSNHLRQQVVSRLVDGIIAYSWAEMDRVVAASKPRQTDVWRTEAALTASLVKMAVGPITGDPALWARRLARNIDVNAFRIRLDKGQVPGVDTRANPWGPTAETLISTTPTGDVNEKKVAIAEWHEANQRNTEDIVLKYHDSEMQLPYEEHDGYNDEHDHDPLA